MAPSIQGTQKEIIILTTTHMVSYMRNGSYGFGKILCVFVLGPVGEGSMQVCGIYLGLKGVATS